MSGEQGTLPSSSSKGGIPITSPFYLHPSESPGAIISSCVFNGENYDTWANQARTGLKAKNKLGFVDGTVTKPKGKEDGDTTEEGLPWEICNSMITVLLFNIIDSAIHPSISYFDATKGLWDDLRERYMAGNASRVYH